MTTAVVLTLLFYSAIHLWSVHDKPARVLRHDAVSRWHIALTLWSMVCAIYLWRAYL